MNVGNLSRISGYTIHLEKGVYFFMKTKTTTKHVIIKQGKPEDIDREINAILGLPNLISHRLTYLNDSVMFAAVEYSIETTVYENIKEEFEAKGEIYYCDDCPYLERSTDGRVKSLNCKCGKTTISRRACLLFYQELAKGEIAVR